MQFSYKWIQEYFEDPNPTLVRPDEFRTDGQGPLPEIKDLVEILTFHAFEIEGVNGDLIDIDVLPNRAHDCLCYEGIAKEISVLTGLKLKENKIEVKTESGLKSEDHISLEVEDSVLVPRATKRLVQNVKIETSPDWLRKKLESIGQKSINNVVDITNYVMWETGQPVHAFDFDKIAGDPKKEFYIRNAKKGEKITTLDGQEFDLDESIIVISDKDKALDIAGIKGGIVSGIDENTQNIVLSICNFNQTNIRKTSRKLGLRTDASVRFENGVSPDKVGEAMERLTQLIIEITGGKASEDILDVYPRKANLYKVGVSTSEVNRLLGLDFSDKDMEDIFNRFGFDFEKVNPIDKVLELAPIAEGKRYRNGASVTYDAPEEYDCSSFTAYLFVQAGIGIPRISVDQYVWGEEILDSDLKAGDLVFFNTEKGKIHTETIEFLKGTKVEKGIDHVALYLGDGKIIHASDKNEEDGEIFIEELKESKFFENVVGYRRMSGNSERYVVSIPHERLDLRIKEDLIEEIGRVYGYRNIEPELVNPNFSNEQGKIFKPKINKEFYYINKIRNILVEAGFSEVYTYTFGDKGNVEVQKPLASNLGFLRTNLSDGVQKSLELNIKNAPVLGLDEIKIFEIGKVFPDIDGEYLSISLGIASLKNKKKKNSLEEDVLQDVLSKLIEELGLSEFDIRNSELVKEILKPNRSFEFHLDKLIEELPEPYSYEDVLKMDSNDPKFSVVQDEKIFKSISNYPFMLRDISVFVPNEFSENDLLEIIKENAGDLLVQSKLFDIYSPEGGDKTSYAFNLVFQSQEKTLTDEEINEVMDKITSQIQSKNWEVR
ncbi:MAG: C40 family peptidase [Candidatus Pacebacteria bacterium]|nr:C40 family peptidase [Candidatus Paceibacterota bacterium]